MPLPRLTRRIGWLGLGVLATGVGLPALALVASVGETGIDARRLQAAPYNLTGQKISIGQVEIGRPALFGLDKTAQENFAVRPRQLFFRDRHAQSNQNVDRHAANVASVMISNHKSNTGVAPNARLYAAAAGLERQGGQPQECLASQTVATQNGGDVRAINFSFGESLLQDPRPNAVLDGNALLTQCIDWSSREHNVLYVIAGNQGSGGIPIPTDHFNGMTVANSIEFQGMFRKVSFSDLGSEPAPRQGRPSETNEGPRRSISIAAPGTKVRTINPDGVPSNPPQTGTSFAAPHVVATVALLQEWGDRQLFATTPGWDLNARRHEVMKAVMMNAADKLEDNGNGLTLGMSRTAVNQQNQDWLESDAFADEMKPLDANLGTGHLNAFRAWQQFSAGQWKPDSPVPAIGWDYGRIGNGSEAPSYQDYVFEQPLKAGSYVAATLTWDRLVELDDVDGNGQYDIGDRFIDRGLNNLDIYLMRAEDNAIEARIRGSMSAVDSVEHIFHPVSQAGRYKIRVVHRNQANEPVQDYAIAWWTAPVE
ncbi:S8 family serine peptidase [Leptolyngbya sp. AN02str]|uniref:S8 family serine peptidase n=1 Tax=Leptolyngbya sp. AN02str TaxID=3423363 RepID=UPI003D321D5E